MKNYLILFLLFFSSVIFSQQKGPLEGNPIFVEVTVLSGNDYVDVDLSQLLPYRGYDLPKLIGIFTDATMTSTSLTIQPYDPINLAYKELEESDGGAYTLTIEASKFYPVNTNYLAGVLEFRIQLGSAEAADRSLVLACRVY